MEVCDTVNFTSLSSDEYKSQTKKKWTADPCGSTYSEEEVKSKEFYEEVEKHRYKVQDWTLDAIKSFDIKGRKVLELGFGMGTDHLNLARQGAIMHGLDLTPRNKEITEKRFEMYGLKTELTTGDAENLPYEDNTFDFIYSFGVIHHSPDTDKIVSEVHRVLKPGGKCFITVYNKNSIFFYWSTFLINYMIRKGYKERTLKQQISKIEAPGTNEDLVIKLYKKKEFLSLFKDFNKRKAYVRQLVPADLGYFRSLFKDKQKPYKLLKLIGKFLGWYIVVEAEK